MGVMSDLHGNYANTVFSREFKYPGQTLGTMTLKRIGIGPWFVGAHPGTDLILFLQDLHHGFDVGRIVHGAEAGKYMK